MVLEPVRPGSRPSVSVPHTSFDDHLALRGEAPLRHEGPTTLQVNIGLRCNLACHHCHVESGPRRSEALSAGAIDRVLELLAQSPSITTLDVTGGAPELHPDFRRLVVGARASGLRVLDRCNLTVLDEPGQEDTAVFLAANQVEVIASLPCYTPGRVDAQRGRGVFEGSIRALLALGELGYGRGDGLVLDLVYNPNGASLPPAQEVLEAEYREALRRDFGIEFDHLLALTNMPIRRFARALEREGEYERYMALLVEHFNPATLPGLMCRNLVSVGHDGRIHDCDFNQALGIPMEGAPTLFDIESFEALAGRRIATGRHCFGCTAGAGSSCGGSLAG